MHSAIIATKNESNKKVGMTNFATDQGMSNRFNTKKYNLIASAIVMGTKSFRSCCKFLWGVYTSDFTWMGSSTSRDVKVALILMKLSEVETQTQVSTLCRVVKVIESSLKATEN